jgi:hypothetical protein
MALTRAQLLSGNPAQGTVLAGQVQAFTAGSGLIVSGTGVLSIDTGPSFTAFVKTNNSAAYNAYVWPNTAGNSGQQLTTDGSGNLSWSDPDNIAWTAKGQLIVGTGVNTDALLNPGADTAVLVADSASATGLAYSDSLASAIQLPAGATGNQPPAPSVGMVRYNTSNNEFEGYSGSPASWQALGGMPTGGGNDKIFYLNSQIVTTDYTIPTTPLAKNAMSSGPITIAAGVTVTVPAGSNWAIV